MYVQREIQKDLENTLFTKNKITVLYGPRQAGKTTLSKNIIEKSGLKTLSINADQSKFIDILSSRDLNKLQGLVSGYDLLFIDEGQRVPEIGINLKILHDEIPGLRILVTGSSSFLLSNRISEVLTGRKRVFTLTPFSIRELSKTATLFELQDKLNERLVFGSYPELFGVEGLQNMKEYLNDITSSYLYKDILELETIRYPHKIRDLLRLLAYQVGSQVNISELSKNLKLNSETIERYLFLLEQSFIIFKLSAFSTNPRKEVSKSDKYFFFDNGIRNMLIDDLRMISERNDTGQLWENFIISEKYKNLLNSNDFETKAYFWRNYNGTEIDYIEKSGESLKAYEIKYNKTKKTPPLSWRNAYGNNFVTINKDNFMEFLT